MILFHLDASVHIHSQKDQEKNNNVGHNFRIDWAIIQFHSDRNEQTSKGPTRASLSYIYSYISLMSALNLKQSFPLERICACGSSIH